MGLSWRLVLASKEIMNPPVHVPSFKVSQAFRRPKIKDLAPWSGSVFFEDLDAIYINALVQATKACKHEFWDSSFKVFFSCHSLDI